jgi:predicted amidohydrolase
MAGICLCFCLAVSSCRTKKECDVKKETPPLYGKGPRPVVLGTCTMARWELPDSTSGRIIAGEEMFDAMAAAAGGKGLSLDIVLFPEGILQAGKKPEKAQPVGGPVVQAMARKCAQYSCYAGVPLCLKEGSRIYNSLVILDRQGKPAGTYRKVHPVIKEDGSLESGITPGKNYPVFDLDFGRVGVMICWDAFYPEGWDALGRKGAELVLFSSAMSAVADMKSHAWRNRYYVLASTFRAPTVIVDPLGGEAARTAGDREVLVEKIDLDYRILPWNTAKDFGRALGKKYGDKIKLDWHYEEDLCLLTSRVPDMPIQQVMDAEDLFTLQDLVERSREKQDLERGGAPDLK